MAVIIPECEKLIRRMLHLDPSKRITMASVLKHRWMQGPESDPPSPTHNHLHVRVFGSSDNLLWNEQVLRAIQRMNYNVEACKQVSEILLKFNFILPKSCTT